MEGEASILAGGAPDLEPFRAYLRADGCSPRTVDSYVQHVRAMLGADGGADPSAWLRARFAALELPVGTANVMRAAVRQWLLYKGADEESDTIRRLPRGTRVRRRIRDALPPGELEAFYKLIDGMRGAPVPRTILLLLPRTGLRIGEMCALRVADVGQDGDGTYGVRVRRGKGGHERFVPLTDDAAAVLRRYIRTHLPPGSDWLFPGRSGPIRPDSVREWLRKLRRDTRLVPHVLRHTFATASLESGMNIVLLGDILGHTNLNTTRRYTHARGAAMKAAMERAAPRLRPGTPDDPASV